MQEMQEQMKSMNDSGEFLEVESKPQWEIVLRTKLLFHAEPRQTLATWHMEHRLDYGKRFLVINFLQLIHEVIQDRFQCVFVQELLSQEMKI